MTTGFDTVDDNDASIRHTAVTIHDVAEHAGVSIATVSRAFSQPGRVSTATLSKVHRVARDLGYHAETIRPVSQDELRGLISIVVTDLENPINVQFTRGMQQYCSQKNYGLLVADTEENTDNELAIIKRSLNHVDGMVLASPRLPDSTLRMLSKITAAVMLNRPVDGVHSLVTDCSSSLAEAVRTLKVLGHRQVTYILGPDNSWQNKLRLSAIREACAEEGLKSCTLPCAYPVGEATQASFQTFLRHPTSAVIAFDDAVAVEFMHFLADRGVSIPAQVSVMGVNDIPMCRMLVPPLSTISFPWREMGRFAAQLVIDHLLHIEDPSMTAELRHVFPSKFVMRDSMGPVNPLMTNA